MLQEILLSLSGHSSPLFEKPIDETHPTGLDNSFPLLSPPERSLLESLANLSKLHRDIRSSTSAISSSHPSSICRAVASIIASDHLGRFQQKVLEVEKDILQEDAAYVGGYGIVPLSTVVGEFSGWTRRMEWLRRTVDFMNGTSDSPAKNTIMPCTGPDVINHLRKENARTGYLEIEEIAKDLIQTAEIAWMRQLATWILYGKLPSFGGDDFFIHETPGATDIVKPEIQDFSINESLLPEFVNAQSASSILFIGKSLNHIRVRQATATSYPESSMLSTHLQALSTIKTPITTSNLTQGIATIRRSLSQNVLSSLLPVAKIVDVLVVLQQYLLLDKGEFAVSLISRADEHLQQRHKKSERTRQSAGIDGISVKEGEVATVLSRVWGDLASLQNDDAPEQDVLDMAQDLLRLSLGQRDKTSKKEDAAPESEDPSPEFNRASFDDFLFSAPTRLSIRIQPPLDLFLNSEELSIYSSIHSYLLGIRRAHLHLSNSWKQSSMRREHPAPLGPPSSNSPFGAELLLRRRQRSNQRTVMMRKIWATTGAVLFLLSELSGYLQGKAVNGHWLHFLRWLTGDSSRPNSSAGSRPGTASSAGNGPGTTSLPSSTFYRPPFSPSDQRDPEVLVAAHKAYLSFLTKSLLLSDAPFTQTIRPFLTDIDHFRGVLTRLQTVQQNLDLEADEGVFDALTDYATEEKNIMVNLFEARTALEGGMKRITRRLREIEEERHGSAMEKMDMQGLSFGSEEELYVPWKGPGIDELLMKLDFGTVEGKDVDEVI